jgi:type IV pilus assembly protein PilM
MSALNQITRLVKDPPPSYLFELSEAGIAFSQNGHTGFQPLEPGALMVSPIEDNVKHPDAVRAAIQCIATPNAAANGKRGKLRHAAVILPDYAARVTVLDFVNFPSDPDEQLSLVRFRIKKTIPFEIESAAISYFVQPQQAKGKIEVVAVTVTLEIVARYESLFRNTGYHPGLITTSALASLSLYHGEGMSVVAKLSGRVLTVMAISGNVLKLLRCVMLDEVNEEEVLGVLHPTFSYVEDELGSPPKRLLLCGFPFTPERLPCFAEPLRSRLGTPGAFNAGLLGYMESAA